MATAQAEVEPREIKRLVEKITTTGCNKLDEKDMKKLKKICKNDDRTIPFVHELLFNQLKRTHSEIRLSAFQVINELFQRSHVFRELIIADLQEVIEHVVETTAQLPPPKAAREQLKREALETIQQWVQKFGDGYKKLALGYNYLKQVKLVDFANLEARNELVRRREEERTTKMNNIWKERVKRVKQEMIDTRDDIDECLTQVDGCLSLLIPKPENFFHDENDSVVEESSGEGTSRGHGMFNVKHSITVDVVNDCGASLEKNQDNEAVIDNLRDQNVILVNKLLPMAKKWTITLTKAGENVDSDTLKKSIDVKQLLEEAEAKIGQLNLPILKRIRVDDSDTDDDDFIEVSEDKDGYEETAVFDDALGIPFYDMPKEESAKRTTDTSKRPPSLDDPGEGPSKRPLTPESMSQELKNEPVASVLVFAERPRFWGAGDDGDVVEVPGAAALANQKIVHLEEKFEPVKWSCRAPLPSGRLCPRKDRFKCPLHGPVIPRNAVGMPSDPKDFQADEEQPQDWQDQELLRDIQAATGLDLKVEKRKKGKKNPGLTDIKQVENTTRKRLGKKIFNKSAMRRVASHLNKVDGITK